MFVGELPGLVTSQDTVDQGRASPGLQPSRTLNQAGILKALDLPSPYTRIKLVFMQIIFWFVKKKKIN